jgi:hypothetical protein
LPGSRRAVRRGAYHLASGNHRVPLQVDVLDGTKLGELARRETGSEHEDAGPDEKGD